MTANSWQEALGLRSSQTKDCSLPDSLRDLRYELEQECLELDTERQPPRCAVTEHGILPNPGEGQDIQQWMAAFTEAFGTTDLDELSQTLSFMHQVLGKDECALNALVTAIADLQPRDPLERRLLIQALLVHHKAAQALVRASQTHWDDEREAQENRALKFMRLFAQQMATLQKYRRNGQQTVVVNHVTANQAVVAGSVQTQGRGV